MATGGWEPGHTGNSIKSETVQSTVDQHNPEFYLLDLFSLHFFLLPSIVIHSIECCLNWARIYWNMHTCFVVFIQVLLFLFKAQTRIRARKWLTAHWCLYRWNEIGWSIKKNVSNLRCLVLSWNDAVQHETVNFYWLAIFHLFFCCFFYSKGHGLVAHLTFRIVYAQGWSHDDPSLVRIGESESSFNHSTYQGKSCIFH